MKNSRTVALVPPIAKGNSAESSRFPDVLSASGHVTVQWSASAAGYQLQTSDSLAADSWTTVTTIPANQTEMQLSKGAARAFFRLRRP